ncbi:MAG: hypothetical protein HY372_03810 [Candidatus Andersenbacteria bacterium]|nr:hypothetical protein [Candidatus Andersenbacteria bacterium]
MNGANGRVDTRDWDKDGTRLLGPGWWKGLTFEELGAQASYLSMVRWYYAGKWTHIVYRYGEIVEEAAMPEVVVPGLSFALIRLEDDLGRYLILDDRDELHESRSRPRWMIEGLCNAQDDDMAADLPGPGWWKGLKVGEFAERLRTFQGTKYDLSYLAATRYIARRSVPDPDPEGATRKGRHRYVLGRLGGLEMFMPTGAFPVLLPRLHVGFVSFSGWRYALYTVVEPWLRFAQLVTRW